MNTWVEISLSPSQQQLENNPNQNTKPPYNQKMGWTTLQTPIPIKKETSTTNSLAYESKKRLIEMQVIKKFFHSEEVLLERIDGSNPPPASAISEFVTIIRKYKQCAFIDPDVSFASDNLTWQN
jgi:hypothetical protein